MKHLLRYWRHIVVFWTCLCAAGVSGCSPERTAPTVLFVSIDTATSLEVVDWGGEGIPIVFLAGLGHTAHVFDDLAPELTSHFRVFGITRRGFGASSQPDSGYAIPTLVEDIRIVLDSLGIKSTVVVGHSLGGDEMTLLARRYPERIAALVYIEAAYLRASARDSMAQFESPESTIHPATPSDKESMTAYQAYYARANGVTMPLSEIQAMYRWNVDGSFGGSLTPSRVYSSILGSLRDPDYSGITCPALAVYATEYPVTELFIDYEERDSLTRKVMSAYHQGALRIDGLSRTHFRTHMPHGRVVEMSGAGHSLYLTHRKETLKIILGFLEEAL